MNPNDPFDTSMFVGQGADDVSILLQRLEPSLPLMGDEDREFVLGCKMSLEAGGVVTAQNRQRLAAIARSLNALEHDTLGGVVEKPISIPKVLQDLAANVHTLLPDEKAFANRVAGKIRAGQQLTPTELQELLTIYYNKGF